MSYRKENCIFAVFAVWYETCYESLHKPGLVTAPPTGQSTKVSVANTSCISDVPLCAVLDQFCICFFLFCVSSFSVCWIFSKIGSDKDKTTHIQLLDFILQKSLNSFAGEDTRQEVSHYLGKAFAYWHAATLPWEHHAFLVPPTGQKW